MKRVTLLNDQPRFWGFDISPPVMIPRWFSI